VRLLIAIPVHNEARYVGAVLDKVKRFHDDILVVDDGSTDATGAILKARDDVNVVLHTHSTFSTILAVHERGIPCFHYMVAVAGGNDIRCAPYACFGTQALSDHALAALEGRNACLLGHHGLIVTGPTFEKALWLAVEVETLAKMYVHALAIGEPPRLTEAEMTQVHEQIRRMGYGQAPDLDGVGDVPRPKSI